MPSVMVLVVVLVVVAVVMKDHSGDDGDRWQ
jgi:hypothetical protein